MQKHIQKLSERLANACARKEENGSENHWTATSWLLFFEDLNCRVIFDSEGTGDRDRPDLQVWFSKSGVSPDIWVESKFPHEFKSISKRNRAHVEVLEKLRSCLRHGQALPKFIVITDFETSYVWQIDSFKRLLETGAQGEMFEKLGKPYRSIQVSGNLQFNSEMRELVELWKTASNVEEVVGQSLDLDQLISQLLLVSSDFRDNFLAGAVSELSERPKLKKLYQEWLISGGELTVEAVNQDLKKSNIGGEEAFAELCFHSVMVRCFVLKWFLDHGHLKGSETATLWGAIGDRSSVTKWRDLLAPRGKTPAEKVLANLLSGSDVYLWVLDTAPSELWTKIRQAFNRYTLVAERSDILGEFYQQYMKKYAKKSQLLLGQFYTPHRLTRAMWKVAGEVMREKGVSLADKSCLVIDPCTGTGTFLNQGLRLLLDGGWGETKKTYKGAELNPIFARFTGFEVNPLSRGVALVNSLTEVLSHASDGCETFDPVLRIFETNAYDIPDPTQQDFFSVRATSDEDEAFRAWRREILEASKAKAKSQYRIVIGNPPWRNPSPACKNSRIQSLLQDDIMPWAWEYEGNKLSSIKGCNHGIRDDYVFFFGLGMRLLQERGLLVFVTNESWLNAPTYTMFRRYLLDNFKVHSIVRVGPYFEGVKERAAVVAFEKSDKENESAGRGQKIRYLDWSDLSNPDWSKQWIDNKLQSLIDGDVKRSEYQSVSASGDGCTLRPVVNSRLSNNLLGCVSIESIFKDIDTGAQAGCGPVFLNSDKTILERRIKLLFQGKKSELVKEISSDVRGGKEKSEELVQRICDSIREYDVKFDRDAIRPIWAHFKSSKDKKSKQGWCYFDARLWLFPRVAREAPRIKNLWDIKPKLVFRDIYDPDDKFITSTVEKTGIVIDNHFFNGGVYVASVKNPDGSTRLTKTGEKLRAKFSTDEEFLYYISAFLNSPQVHEWSKACPQERVKIPVDVDAKLAIECAKIEKELDVPWMRESVSKSIESSIESLLADLESRQEELKRNPTDNVLPFIPKTKFDQVLEQRLAIASTIVNVLNEDKHFGRVKLTKLFYLADMTSGLDLKTEYYREVAGPLDQRALYNEEVGLEALAAKHGYFNFEEKKSGKVVYLKGPNLSKIVKSSKAILGIQKAKVDSLAKLFESMTTDQAEIVATIYACWNDLLLDKKIADGESIAKEFLKNWHPKKLRFPKSRILKAIDWMKKNGLVPNGKGKRTKVKQRWDEPA